MKKGEAKEMKKIKTKAPINLKISDFLFPAYDVIRIYENVTLYAVQDNTQPLVSLALLFPIGANSEKRAGLSYFCSQMLKRGTKKRSSQQIAGEFDQFGATLNIASNWDYTKAGFTCLETFLEKCFEILSDCIFNSVFQEDELKRLKEKHTADIEQELAEPSYLADISLNKGIFEKHPYGHPMIGTKKSIAFIERKDCLKWHASFLTSPEINIVASGNFNLKKLIQVIKKFLPAQSVKKHDEIKLPGFNKEPENKIIIKHKKDSGQTNLRIGKLTINPHHSDFPGLQFANTVFGGFFLSRLNKLLREELGYTYGVSSYINSKKLASVHIVSTSINKESTGDTIKRIIEQMDIIRSRKISDEEYILVRQYLLGSFLRSTETSRQVAGLIKNLITGNLPKDYYTDFYNRIKNITIDEIFNCQNKYFSSSKLTIAAVGDKNLLIESIG